MMKKVELSNLKEKPKPTKTRRVAVIGLLTAVLLFLSLGVIVFANHGPAGSHLVDVGPVSPEHGFPMWYQDANGLILEPCTDPTLCWFFPPDPAAPVSFPGNFSDELFYWAAEALMIDATPPDPDDPAGGLGRAILTLGLEGAFMNDEIIMGDQVVFGRIRIRVDNLIQGETYTVTHPYGVDIFVVGQDGGPGVIAGPGISFVEDIGIGQMGDFTGALNSRIGPFLTWDPATAPPPPPGYIADGGLTLQKVVGSPFGANFFRVEGPNVGDPSSAHLCADPALGPDPAATTDCIETDLFSVQGKYATRFGVGIDQVTYSRNGDGAGSVNVFANSVSALPQTIQASAPALGSKIMAGDAAGNYFTHLNYAGNPPALVTAANISDDPQTAVTGAPSDLVAITRAEFNLDTGELIIEAASSDIFGPPTLTAIGYGNLVTGSLAISGLTIPPWQISVSSSAGGSDTEPVKVVSGSRNIAPTAGDDVVATLEETPVTFGVLTNDSDPDGALVPASAAITDLPVYGSVVNHGDGTFTYTPNTNYFGADIFRYTVQDNGGATSNKATVTINIANVNDAPVAVDDNAPGYTVAVLTNDYDIDGTLDPGTVIVVTPPTNGTAVPNLDGTITYTPTVGFTGSDSFGYTVKDNSGALSNAAAVSMTVTSGAPIVSITTPADGDSFIQGASITFTGQSSDNQDGDLSANLAWTSSLDGAIGTGAALAINNLSLGAHIITAAVTDSDSNPASDAIAIAILGGPSPVAVGPVHPDYGFPVWYQDSLGMILEICLDGQDPLCGFVPGDIPDPNTPVSFPDNFPQEAFWSMAEGLIEANGIQALLGIAVEAAFANGPALPGDQVTFARIRIRITGLAANTTYTVTHPYGVETMITDGAGGIDFTQDIGGDNPGNFIGLFNALPGPFLTWSPLSDAPAGYIGNPLVEHQITGSPYGANYFRIEGPNAGGPGINMIETDMFALMGKLATVASGPGNTAPVVSITTPFNGDLFNEGTAVSFTATVADAEEPTLGNQLEWTSDMDGLLGTGASLSIATLSPGVHVITAYVADTGGLTGAATVSITINGAPSVTILEPTTGSIFTQGTAVAFSGAASDPEDGSLTAGIAWTSNLDGALGTGGSFSLSTLSIGTHLITATVTDSNGLSSQATATITVDAAPTNVAPSISISSPTDGDSFAEGTAVTFSGTASDPEDGILTANIAWSSDRDGAIGTGGSFSVSSLSAGTHQITASITDSGGLTTTASVSISITVAPVDIITITRGDYISKRLLWRVAGAGSEPGAVITIYIGPTIGGNVLGTAVVNTRGSWKFREIGSSVFPDGSGMISIASSGGGVYEGFRLRIK